MSLATGIILLIIGIVLAACARMLPAVISTIALIAGIILAAVGLILIILVVLGIAALPINT
jgi:hypothetical protein